MTTEDLIKNGWKEIDGVWESPVTLTGIPHLFFLGDALQLEREGRIYEYAAEMLQAKMRHDDDLRQQR